MTNVKCSQCGSGDFVHFDHVDDGELSGYSDMALNHGKGFGNHHGIAVLEAYVCKSCGHVEFFTKDFNKLK